MFCLLSHFEAISSMLDARLPLVCLRTPGSQFLVRVSNLACGTRVPNLGCHWVGCITQYYILITLSLGAVGPSDRFLTVGLVPCRFNLVQRSKMPTKKDIASSSAVGQGGASSRTTGSPVHPYPGKPTELLNKQEFRDRFCFPNGISVQLVEVISYLQRRLSIMPCISPRSNSMQGFAFPFHPFSNNSSTSPKFPQPSFILILSGC